MQRKTKFNNTISTKITNRIGKMCNRMMKTWRKKSPSLSRKIKSLKRTRKKKSLKKKMNGKKFTAKRLISENRKIYGEDMRSTMLKVKNKTSQPTETMKAAILNQHPTEKDSRDEITMATEIRICSKGVRRSQRRT